MQGRPGSPVETLFGSLTRLRQAWPKRGWSWDTRIGCVASSFGVDLVQEARAAAKVALPTEYTQATLRGAPAAVREIAEQTGGLRPDQLLMCSEPNMIGFAYGLWWPWGDDTTISLRIGLTGRALSVEMARFREIFGAAD
jgi:hypothetical protein